MRRLLFDAGSIVTVISPLLLAVIVMMQSDRHGDSSGVIVDTSELRPAVQEVADAARDARLTGDSEGLFAAIDDLHTQRDRVVEGLHEALPDQSSEPLATSLNEAIDEFTGAQAAYTGLQSDSDPARETEQRLQEVIGSTLVALSTEAQSAVTHGHSDFRRSQLLIAVGVATSTAMLLMWRRRARSAWRRNEGATRTIERLANQGDRAERRLHALKNFDTLTRLPSREHFVRLTEVAIVEARRSGTGLAVLTLDLSRFKLINDTLGHASGDRLLAAVAQRLREELGGEHPIARLGGDEFLVLVGGLPRANASAGYGAGEVARRIREALREPFEHDGQEFPISAHVGFSVFPARAEDAEELLRQSSSALYRAKTRGASPIQFYDPRDSNPAAARLQLEAELRRAIERDEFCLYYQPQVEMEHYQIRGVEALLRWQHPARGIVEPSEFVPLLEDMGEIVTVGRWAISQACLDAQGWALAGLPPVRVGINLSAHQFLDPELLPTLRSAIKTTGIDPTRLELEITETIAMTNVEPAVQILEELNGLGVRTALDDFGTGYSSLGRLHEFPVQTLKIDRSFVSRLGGDDADPAIVKGVIALGHALELHIVAEGIETDSQASLLRQLGTDLAQGFVYSEPVDEPTMRRLLSDGIDHPELPALAG